MTSHQQHRTADTPIAIVGVAGLFPMAHDHRDFWQNIVDAADCTQDVPASRWRVEDYYDPDPGAPDKTYCTRGGFVPDVAFSPLEWGLPPNQMEVTTVVQMLSLGVARDLLRDAGAVDSTWYDPARTGVVLGVAGPTTLSHPLAARLSTPVLREVVRSCGLSEQDAEEIAARYVEAFPPWEENSFPGLLGNVIAGRVANRLDLGGMNCTVDAACASSLSAVHIAIGELLSGRADMMITGGADTENSVFGYMCFAKTQALSKSGRIRPFDDSADGTLVGEGIGMLALKRLADAERDGDRVYAVIRGVGASSDGRFKSIYAPRAEGQVVALRRAYADADCSPASIGLFEAHATGTRVGDKTELTALNELLSSTTEEKRFAAIGSVKSQIGHTKGAAGAASLIKLAMGLYHKTLPPTINVERPNTTIDFDAAAFYLNTGTRPWITDPRRPVRRAAASAMGFGGTNFHVVLEEASADRAVTRTLHRTAHAFLWHAPDRDALLDLLRSGAEPSLGAIPADHARIGFVGEELREQAIAELAGSDAEQWSHPSGIFYRRRALPSVRVGALFAGQGSQYVNMGLSAVLNNPLLGTAFDEANAVFDGSSPLLSEVVYPAATFDGTTDTDRELALRRTEYAQPAIGALSVGHFRFLRELGLECAGFLGHSFGELTALWAAGSLSDSDFFELARARGLAMSPPAADFDAGAMVAVDADRATVEEILTAHPDVTVCNHNAPDQVVVGGATIAVADVVAACNARGLTAKVLPVAAAFHTSHVGHAVDAFRASLSTVDIAAPIGPVYANTRDAAYGEDVDANRTVLAEQLRNPVEFVTALQSMHADGCTVLVEFGPRRVLTQLAIRTLPDIETIAIDLGPKVDSDLALKRAAIQLAVLGAPITDINRHDAPAPHRPVPTGMTITLNGRDHVPDTRHAAYATALNGDYQVESTRPRHQATGEPEPHTPAHPEPHSRTPEQAEAGSLSVTAASGDRASEVAHAPVQVELREPVPEVIPVESEPTSVPVEQPLVAGFGEIAARHLDLHTRYVEGQLRVADGLVSALRSAPDGGAGLHAAVEAVTDQSIAIGEAHVRVNEILAALTELEFSPTRLAPAPALLATPAISATPAAPTTPALTTPAPATPDQATVPAPAAVAPAAGPATPVTPPVSQAPTAPDLAKPSPVGNGQTKAGSTPAEIESALLRIVADKTGYPPEMVDPTMDLEADLGVDSIKRVQILGTLGERFPALPAVGPEQVAELRTLADVVAYMGTPAAPQPRSEDQAIQTARPESSDAIQAALVEIVADKTGYPTSMIDPTMDLEADLGVDSIKRVQILGTLGERFPALPAVGPEQVAELRTLADVVAYMGAPALPQSDGRAIQAVLVEIVADKTGYPVSMIDPTMDLEADLGVDSIKRVQILGTLGERFPALPAVGPEQVAELRTLADVVAYMGAPNAPQPRSEGQATQPESGAAIQAALVEIVADKTGYPTSMIDPTMDLEADLGVDSIKRVQILGTLGERFPDLPPVGPEQIAELRTLADVVTYLGAEPSAEPPTEPTFRRQYLELVRVPDVDEARARYADNPVAVVSHADDFADALEQRGWTVIRHTGDQPPAADRVDLCLVGLPTGSTWADTTTLLTEHLLLAKHTVPALRQTIANGTRAAFISVTTLDGALGHEGAADPADALAGGIAGLVKTLRHEVPGLFCRALDFSPRLPRGAAVDRLAKELNDAAAEPVEVGIDHIGHRWTAVFAERPAVVGESALTEDDVIVVTGGARGVTAECVRALAGRAEFVLLGRTELADLPEWLTDGDFKPQLIEHMRAAGPVTPREVDRRHRELLAQREIHHTLNSVKARYISVDVTDADAVREALKDIPVTGVVHGAGALADALITDKTRENLDTVLGPKLTGLRAVLDAVDESRLRHLVLFTSVAGVFGNTGQSDYAVANEALGRAAASWKRAAPHRRVTAINWGAWAGGMVTPELAELFRQRGVDLLPLDTGAAMFAEQFTDPHLGDIEILIGPAEPLTGPRTPSPTPALLARRDVRPLGDDPVIDDHRIGAHPVFPASAALGWIAGALERANPGLRVIEVRGFEVQRGIVFDGSPEDEYWLDAEPGTVVDDTLVINAAVVGNPDTQRRSHYRGTFVLATTPAPAPTGTAHNTGGGTPTTAYTDADLFHGPLLQGVRRVLDRAPRRLVAECALADEPVGLGAYRSTLHSPVLGDVVLQAAAVLGVWFLDAGCLPLTLGRWEFFAPLPDGTPFVATVDNLRDGPMTVTVDVVLSTPEGRVLQRVTDVSVVTTPDMKDKFTEAVHRRTDRPETTR